MKFKNVLILYKRSAYKIYFSLKSSSLYRSKNATVLRDKKNFENADKDHYDTLHTISKVLLVYGVRFTECYRGRGVNYNKYDLVITVGGDGTFLEAARKINNQVLFGVNSAPHHSVGRFCIATAENFEHIFKRILLRKYEISKLHRIRMKVEGQSGYVDALNDVLICHHNPAVLCRYTLKFRGKKEEQRSSGVWIATPAGSSGAVMSAGGKLLSQYDNRLQYVPRELYQGKSSAYKLKGSIVGPRQKISVTSLMRKGMIYVDGAHKSVSFPYGCTAKFNLSPKPIRTIRL